MACGCQKRKRNAVTPIARTSRNVDPVVAAATVTYQVVSSTGDHVRNFHSQPAAEVLAQRIGGSVLAK